MMEDGPLIVIFGSSHPLSTKKKTKKKMVSKFDTPLTIFSGSAHAVSTYAVIPIENKYILL